LSWLFPSLRGYRRGWLRGDVIAHCRSARRDVRLLLARDVGQVRDILRSVIDNPAITHVYPTVQVAVAAAQTRT
jgi:hypothetical protein